GTRSRTRSTPCGVPSSASTSSTRGWAPSSWPWRRRSSSPGRYTTSGGAEVAGTERATDPAPTTNRRLPRPGTIAQNVAVVVVLSLPTCLPPDTPLREVQQRGSLRVCVPVSYPPLVSGGDPDRPGIDIELVRELASRLALTVRFNENSAIGRDFNPRNWRVT